MSMLYFILNMKYKVSNAGLWLFVVVVVLGNGVNGLTDVNVAILIPDDYDDEKNNKLDTLSSSSNIISLEYYHDYELSILNCKPGHFLKFLNLSSAQMLNVSSTSSLLNVNSTQINKNNLVEILPCPSGTYNPCEGETFNCTLCPLHSYSTTEEGVSCIQCPNGTFTKQMGSNLAGHCLACPAGCYCPHLFSEPIPCPIGTYTPPQSQECIACPLGTFSAEIGRQNVCSPCPTDSVCVNASTIVACPDHTVSPEGSKSFLDCKCLVGFECSYRRQVLVRMSFANSYSNSSQSISQLQNNSALIEILRQSVAKVSGVDLSKVLFKGFRLLT